MSKKRALVVLRGVCLYLSRALGSAPCCSSSPATASWPHTGCCKKRGAHALTPFEKPIFLLLFSLFFCMRQCSKQMQRFPILFNPIFCIRNCSKQMLIFPVLCNSSFLYAKILETDLEFHTNSIGNLNICFEHFLIQKKIREQYMETRVLKRSERLGPLFQQVCGVMKRC